MKGWLGEGCGFPFAGGVGDVEGSVATVVGVCLGLTDVPANVAGAVCVRAKSDRHLGVGKAAQQSGRGIVVFEALARCGGRDLNAAACIVRALGYEAGDLVYHLLVTLERYGITLDELAGELNARRH